MKALCRSTKKNRDGGTCVCKRPKAHWGWCHCVLCKHTWKRRRP